MAKALPGHSGKATARDLPLRAIECIPQPLTHTLEQTLDAMHRDEQFRSLPRRLTIGRATCARGVDLRHLRLQFGEPPFGKREPTLARRQLFLFRLQQLEQGRTRPDIGLSLETTAA
jgi:hypothetical protein